MAESRRAGGLAAAGLDAISAAFCLGATQVHYSHTRVYLQREFRKWA